MSEEVLLQEDCSKCAALCCVALAFDQSDLFAIDKANGQPCPYLAKGGNCSIHQNLAARGFGGCVRYSCNGAGQRVVQELFEGRSWQDDRALLTPMLRCFSVLGQVHDLLILLGAAEKLDLPSQRMEKLARFCRELNPENGWSIEGLETLELKRIKGDVQQFLQSLKPFVSPDTTG